MVLAEPNLLRMQFLQWIMHSAPRKAAALGRPGERKTLHGIDLMTREGMRNGPCFPVAAHGTQGGITGGAARPGRGPGSVYEVAPHAFA
jgi:hypothetical protein